MRERLLFCERDAGMKSALWEGETHVMTGGGGGGGAIFGENEREREVRGGREVRDRETLG